MQTVRTLFDVCVVNTDRPWTLAEIVTTAAASSMQSPAELGYEDLHDLPTLLIVNEKARMGDTFPHSLASLDLRIRTGGVLVALVPELFAASRAD